ncbi:MAG: HAMP domain-containing histidine kinase [Candidatus Thiodiazotropha lotti]|uniref:histidine kinase n=1 Tax=Candidatus Thiodiazotropha lotti TaxID=2792787 RepID=A0A9E4K3T2_9GAMM|nr:HAMP domain-containing histidine kinase [Candidatus Thiodiazotropha lotti]ODB99475.1 hypothetical protein A3197_11070 [Candidatus Thiodiazotropha endoloripes]MCG7931305.1 HAMP domain-containing histidine kinase [Candidatus Thiodiazotropha lotti]MCG7938707.1 HAMP domain-containing histidine kinase [Candidatus Thiodiazotropha lotti]MCG7988062.1 HAMP domain-containing histidine kinase [Candidatus Thiodiazotropha lotti]
MVKRNWSLTERLTAGVGLAMVMLSLVLAGGGYIALSKLFETHLTERAVSQARQLALFSVDAILVYDYATLERYTTELAREPGIVSVLIRRNDGELLAEAGVSPELDNPSLIHVEQGLSIGNSEIGRVFLSVDRAGMVEALFRVGLSGLGLLLLVLAILFLALRKFINSELILPVQQLAQSINPLHAEQCPEPTGLPEELQRLAQTFQRLCGEIKDHLAKRDQAEHMVRSVTERLNRDQRLAVVGQMAAGLAHNLNTPLGSIKGYAQLLEESGDDSQQHQARLIIEQAESCAAKVTNLLTAVRLPEIEQQAFDLHQQVNGAVELIAPILKGYDVKINPPVEPEGERCIVTGDPGALEQILFNLLANAAQAGAIHVNLSVIRTSESGLVHLRVEDDGPGIPSNLQSTLFDPFVTSKPPGEGTGLGLYMSRQIAIQMGAELSMVTQDLNNGACFNLILPDHYASQGEETT